MRKTYLVRTGNAFVKQDYYYPSQIAVMIGKSSETVRSMIDRGIIDGDREPATSYRRVSHRSLVQFLVAGSYLDEDPQLGRMLGVADPDFDPEFDSTPEAAPESELEPEAEPQVEVLVGMIASGKSTYARERARDGALIVNHDDVTSMVHGEYRYEEALHETYHRIEEAIANEVILAGRDLIIDRTHLTEKSRRRWIDFADAHGVPALAIAFPTRSALTHAVRRASADSRGLPVEKWHNVAIAHLAKSEPPDLDEGFACVIHILAGGQK